MRNYTRLEKFLNARTMEIYPEPDASFTIQLTNKMVSQLIEIYDVPPKAEVLDLGCGNGIALEDFQNRGFNPIGVALGKDAAVCRAKGFQIIECDMSFLDFESASFDVIWCRHALEHSIFPYFTLSEMFRMLRPNGVFYIEVPAPGTSSAHETNQNHYSVLTKSMWENLISRAGFKINRPNTISFRTQLGPDEYYAFDGQQ